MKQKVTFTPVNRIGEQCACCGRDRGPRAVRGVRVDEPKPPSLVICEDCIAKITRTLEETLVRMKARK